MDFQKPSDFPFKMFVCGSSPESGCGSQKFQRENYIVDSNGRCVCENGKRELNFVERVNKL